jgi:hypothetical protein
MYLCKQKGRIYLRIKSFELVFGGWKKPEIVIDNVRVK